MIAELARFGFSPRVWPGAHGSNEALNERHGLNWMFFLSPQPSCDSGFV
jgi:hypothetical protein